MAENTEHYDKDDADADDAYEGYNADAGGDASVDAGDAGSAGGGAGGDAGDAGGADVAIGKRVRALVEEMGFALMGVADPSPIEHVRSDYLRDWLAAGKHGEMGYLAENLEKRLDPGKLVPGARSVICVADLYHDTELKATQNPPRPFTGRVAKYARGDDYHKAIKKRLHRLVDTLADEVPDHTFKTTVDTAPLLERDIAVRAGLGWIGKHTLLINPDPALGSYLLLGEIVTTLPLTPSDPFTADHCGTCTRCIDACPTDAIAPDGYKLDASRCISYLTIEHRSEIPLEFHAPMADWLAGCDICQDICPHNRPPPHPTTPTTTPTTPHHTPFPPQDLSSNVPVVTTPCAPPLTHTLAPPAALPPTPPPTPPPAPPSAPPPTPPATSPPVLPVVGPPAATAASPPDPPVVQTPAPPTSLTPPTIHNTYRPKRHGLPLFDILNWSPDDRIAALTGSALKRLRLDMFKRNALILLGNAYRDQTDPATRSRIKLAIENATKNAADAPLTNDTDSDLVRATARTVLKNL